MCVHTHPRMCIQESQRKGSDVSITLPYSRETWSLTEPQVRHLARLASQQASRICLSLHLVQGQQTRRTTHDSL